MCAFFGSYRGKGGGNTITNRGYTGHEQNGDLGLIYMDARYYAPYINRFISADTIVPDPTNPQSFNRYSYVRKNPINFTDLSGYSECGVAGEVCNDELPNFNKIISDWRASGAINNPKRTGALIVPIYSRKDEAQVAKAYIMPMDSEQSVVDQDSLRYKAGRTLAAAGIAIDVG